MTRRGWVLLGTVAFLAAACAGPSTRAVPPVTTSFGHAPPGELAQAVLTSDGTDRYSVRADGGGKLILSAPSTNVSGNLRSFYWRPSSVSSRDQESCQRWDTVADVSTPAKIASVNRAHYWQPGIGLRIAPSADGKGTRGISVDQNVWGGGFWLLWVDVWDSTRSPEFHGEGVIDASSIVGTVLDGRTMAPPPWYVCAQAIGNRVRVKVWLSGPEPSWSDARAVFSVTLPAGWDYAGHPGGYVGHIDPGASEQVTTLRERALRPDG